MLISKSKIHQVKKIHQVWKSTEVKKMLISKSKIHHINAMLITMLKFTYPSKNLFSMNAVPYFFL